MKRDEDRTTDQGLNPALQQLRQEHRAVEAPTHLSALLQAETERLAHRTRSWEPASLRPLRMAWVWGVSLALLAGLVWGLTAWERRGAGGDLPKEVRSTPSSHPVDTTAAPPVSAGMETHRSGETRRNARVKEAEPSIEDFLPLPASEGLPPTSAVSLVRMRIATGTLQQYGLDVPEGADSKTLLAEFVVGEDGLPRAIRIIP